MASIRDDFSAALQRILKAIAELSEDDFQKLLSDSYTVEIKIVRKRHKEESGVFDNIDVSAMALEIIKFSSREEAQMYLDANFSSRRKLEQIARHLNIPILKSDRAEALRDKIVEATVGARLRSQAIQGGLA
jgi:hypothetical protein